MSIAARVGPIRAQIRNEQVYANTAADSVRVALAEGDTEDAFRLIREAEHHSARLRTLCEILEVVVLRMRLERN